MEGCVAGECQRASPAGEEEGFAKYGRGREDGVAVLDFESAVREPSDIAALGLFVEGVRGGSECLSVRGGFRQFCYADLWGFLVQRLLRLRYGPAILNTSLEGGCPY